MLAFACLALAGPAAAYQHQVAGGAPPAVARSATPDAVSRLGQSLLGGGEESEFLDADVAFVPSVEVRDPVTLVARWDIADGYYLYRDKLGFRLAGAAGVALGRPRVPSGEIKTDEFFGSVAVFHHQAEVVLPLKRVHPGRARVTLTLRYQGCAEAGLCYPPITRRLTLDLPATPPRAQGSSRIPG
jgi:thiol:disulfide interchange protein DsbD